jgi:hypothetical protein
MTEIILFTKNGCGKCEHVKSKMPKDLKLRIVNADEIDGLAEAAYHEITEMVFPVLVVDGDVVEGAIPILDRMKALAKRC